MTGRYWVSAPVGLLVALASGCSGPTRPPEGQGPIMARLWIDQVEAYPGTVSELCVRLSSDGNPAIAAEEIGGLDFLLYYDLTALSFQSIKRDSVLSDWEYWTYRLMEPGKPMDGSIALIRILAHRDLDNGVDSRAPSGLPDGPLLRVGFLATSDWQFGGIDSPVGFWRDGCNDNTFWLADYPSHLLIANMDYSPGEDYLAFDTLACARRTSLNPALAFQSGVVQIMDPAVERPFAGDLNLDGERFAGMDFALFWDYYLTGEFPWVAEDSLHQLEAGDCNADGEPFTIADLEFMTRVFNHVIQWWYQIPEPYADTVYVQEDGPENLSGYSVTASKATSLLLLDIELSTDSRPNLTFSDPSPRHFSVRYHGSRVQVLVGNALQYGAIGEGQDLKFQIEVDRSSVLKVTGQASTYPGVPMAVVAPNP